MSDDQIREIKLYDGGKWGLPESVNVDELYAQNLVDFSDYKNIYVITKAICCDGKFIHRIELCIKGRHQEQMEISQLRWWDDNPALALVSVGMTTWADYAEAIGIFSRSCNRQKWEYVSKKGIELNY